MEIKSGRLCAFVVAALCIVGCKPESLTNGAGARLTLLDTVLLAERDTAFVGKASSLLVGPNNRYFVSDLFSKQVLVFDSVGNLELTIGREGKGPGELIGPTFLALDGDSLLYVVDAARVELETFDARSGTFRGQRTFPQRLSNLSVRGSQVLAGRVDPEGGHGVVVVSPEGNQMQSVGPLPDPLKDNVVVRDVFGGVEPLVVGDTLLTAFEVSDYIYVSSISGGQSMDSINLVPTVRHGARRDLLSRITPSNMQTVQDAIYKLSLPVELSMISRHRVALVSLDWQWEHNRVIGTNYVTVADLKRKRTCGDTKIPGPLDPAPRVAMRGDTLFVLAQEAAGDEAKTVIRMYRIDDSTCGWTRAR